MRGDRVFKRRQCTAARFSQSVSLDQQQRQQQQKSRIEQREKSSLIFFFTTTTRANWTRGDKWPLSRHHQPNHLLVQVCACVCCQRLPTITTTKAAWIPRLNNIITIESSPTTTISSLVNFHIRVSICSGCKVASVLACVSLLIKLQNKNRISSHVRSPPSPQISSIVNCKSLSSVVIAATTSENDDEHDTARQHPRPGVGRRRVGPDWKQSQRRGQPRQTTDECLHGKCKVSLSFLDNSITVTLTPTSIQLPSSSFSPLLLGLVQRTASQDGPGEPEDAQQRNKQAARRRLEAADRVGEAALH